MAENKDEKTTGEQFVEDAGNAVGTVVAGAVDTGVAIADTSAYMRDAVGTGATVVGGEVTKRAINLAENVSAGVASIHDFMKNALGAQEAVAAGEDFKAEDMSHVAEDIHVAADAAKDKVDKDVGDKVADLNEHGKEVGDQWAQLSDGLTDVTESIAEDWRKEVSKSTVPSQRPDYSAVAPQPSAGKDDASMSL